ncbi:MAG: hypothetical protein D6687_10840 [Acidobacteria bacterium]|jgi:hypothetical protein|nr:MAG: hypothetical protein D6687_10840 [Acidobacteriota bacterium]GIU81396.1 MAG: hypothetical protein KatS3mg006_0460 [Pyrinomonadaceae bacterium]
MKKRFFILTLMLSMLLGVSAIETLAQKRRPVLRPASKQPAPPVKYYKVNAGTVIRVRMNDTLSSKTAKVGDRFTVTVTEPVYSNNGLVVIPVGSTITGRVDSVVPAKKGGKPGQIDVSFVSVKLPNGQVRAINGSLTALESEDAKSDEEGTVSGDRMKHRKVIFIGGGGAGGAIIGAAVGGGKGAVIGGIIGAGAGLLGERLTKGEEAEVKPNTEFGVYLNQAIYMPKWN